MKHYQYFFILGNTPNLSSAELMALLFESAPTAKIQSLSSESLILSCEEKVDVSAIVHRSGGIVKAGELILEDDILSSIKNEGERKIIIGVSVYRGENAVSSKSADRAWRVWHKKALALKKVLRSDGRSVRIVTAKTRTLSSVAVVTEEMIKRGAEISVFVFPDREIIGMTKAVQDFPSFRFRDMKRPRRNAKRGMLPPKVARIMTNLACKKTGSTVFDPFCGSGTVLMEAMLLGHNVIGSDISKEAIDDTRQNMEWLRVNFSVGSVSSTLHISDVRKVGEHVQSGRIDAIVTEPDLGPPQTGRESKKQLDAIRVNAQRLVNDAFVAFAKILKPGGRVVIALPVIGGESLSTEQITATGFTIIDDPIRYGRPDQHLAREILRCAIP